MSTIVRSKTLFLVVVLVSAVIFFICNIFSMFCFILRLAHTYTWTVWNTIVVVVVIIIIGEIQSHRIDLLGRIQSHRCYINNNFPYDRILWHRTNEWSITPSILVNEKGDHDDHYNYTGRFSHENNNNNNHDETVQWVWNDRFLTDGSCMPMSLP